EHVWLASPRRAALQMLDKPVGLRNLKGLRGQLRVVAAGIQPRPGQLFAVARPAGTDCDLSGGHSFSTLASARASPSSSMGGSTLPRAASGSLRPEPVRTTTVVEPLSIRPSRTRRASRASGAHEAGSANSPSVEASQICACRISVSVTASITPPDSSRAVVAPSQPPGLPFLIPKPQALGALKALPAP